MRKEVCTVTRPAYHYRPEKNWINDPNGLCQINGWYHLFYQYNPHGCQWGDIHWGHARSRDMLHWEDMPIALAPDAGKGEIHCFSGSCCKDEEGRPHFFYTSIGCAEDGRDCVEGAQQWMAEPTDEAMTRLVQSDEWALTDDMHGDMHITDWRDPYVIRWKGQYVMVLGGCLDGRGCILLYTSADRKHWRYRHVLAMAEVSDGVPWECPNLFPVDDRMVLFYSPCGKVMVRVGTLDEEMRFHQESEEVLDPGERQGYYAPQAFHDEAGRTILLGWMPDCDGEKAAERKGWSGVMSLPRVLHIREGRLSAEPLPGVESLAVWHPMALRPGHTCLAEHARRMMARLHCRITDGPLVMTILATADGAEKTTLTLTSNGEMTLNRDQSSLADGPNKTPISRMVTLGEDGSADIFLAVDESTVECAVNGQWLSGRVYPTSEDAAQAWVAFDGMIEGKIGLVEEE